MLQEKKLRVSSKGKKVMSNKEINRFIMFYERLTKHMLKNFGNKKLKGLIIFDERAINKNILGLGNTKERIFLNNLSKKGLL